MLFNRSSWKLTSLSLILWNLCPTAFGFLPVGVPPLLSAGEEAAARSACLNRFIRSSKCSCGVRPEGVMGGGVPEAFRLSVLGAEETMVVLVVVVVWVTTVGAVKGSAWAG